MNDSTNNNPVFKPNRHMLASPRLEAARNNAKQAQTIVKLAIHAVGTHDMELLEMACNANRQADRRMEAFDEELGGAA